jgi:hypothetical protein
VILVTHDSYPRMRVSTSTAKYNYATAGLGRKTHPPKSHHGSRYVVVDDLKPSYRDVVTGNLRRMDD